MSKVKMSKYAEKLRTLGFRPGTEEEQAYIDRRIALRLAQIGKDDEIANLSRSERRRFEKIRGNLRDFRMFENRTIANDGGQIWIVDAPVNLSHLGFVDAKYIEPFTKFVFPDPLVTASKTNG